MITDYLKEQMQVEVDIEEYLNRNETGDAELFARLYQGRVAYDHHSSNWYIWRGQYWERDETREVFGYVSKNITAEYLQASKNLVSQGGRESLELIKRFSDRVNILFSKRRVENILYIAASEPGIRLTGREWDVSPDLLPVNNGVIDLNTGVLRDCNSSEYIRTHAPVDWMGREFPCPIWHETLRKIFNEDQEIIEFIQRLFGYSITGHTNEHKFPIFWGEGRNGKTTILETLYEVLGNDLCMSTQADSLMDIRRSGDGPQPFAYALRGKRLTWATESSEGQRINLGLVKQLTGGDTMTVRTLHSKPITFQPTHKIILLTNHKPTIPADEQAAWDRVLLIPFLMRFVDNPTKLNEQKQDRSLRQKLKAEYPGILAWLVQGCLEWKKYGLNPPASIRAATQSYKEDEDTIGQFVEDCCLEGAGFEVKASELYKCYQEWARGYGMAEMSLKAFGMRVRMRFGEPVKKNTGKYYQAIKMAKVTVKGEQS